MERNGVLNNSPGPDQPHPSILLLLQELVDGIQEHMSVMSDRQ